MSRRTVLGQDIVAQLAAMADGGMKPPEGYPALMGLDSDARLTTSEGIAALDRALAHSGARIAVATAALDGFFAWPAADMWPRGSAKHVARGTLRERTKAYLSQFVAAAVSLPLKNIRPADSFAVYGVDLIIALQLTATLERHLGPLSKTLFFGYEVVDELTNYFITDMIRPRAIARRL